jgi:hypothetical protein
VQSRASHLILLTLWRLFRSVGYIAAGHRQNSHSWFRVPRDSWPYITVSRFWESCNWPLKNVFLLKDTHYVSATKFSRLMLFRETMAVHCGNHGTHKYSMWAECSVLVC